MILLRRFLVVWTLMFWQGGFFFYTSVVVPIGQQVLEILHEGMGDTHQGFITRQVTQTLNWAGVITLACLLADVWAEADQRTWRRNLRWGLWVGMTVSLVGLFGLHQRMDGYLDSASFSVSDRAAFYPLHRVYLWVSTVQWAFGVVFTGLMLAVWRRT